MCRGKTARQSYSYPGAEIRTEAKLQTSESSPGIYRVFLRPDVKPKPLLFTVIKCPPVHSAKGRHINLLAQLPSANHILITQIPLTFETALFSKPAA